jgi:ABC-type sugar transport system ATPase subunit
VEVFTGVVNSAGSGGAPDDASPHPGRSEMAPAEASAAVRMRGLWKSFPGVQALRGVDLDLDEGEVHGLVGENGAGKSTLAKILSGSFAVDVGTIEVFGKPLPPASPAAARRAGIAAVSQEPNIVPKLSPVANVFLGQTRTRNGFLRERQMRQRFLEWSRLLNVSLPTGGAAGALSIGAQQSIEIIRALEQEARIVIMDEPTASLGPAEREALHRTIRLLQEHGAAIIFISHKLDEVLEICETVTVLRDGQKVVSTPASSASVDSLVAAMLGERLEVVLEQEARAHRRERQATRDIVLKIEGVTVEARLHGVDLSVRRGEILGIAGLVGSGRTTLLRAIGGAEPSATGRMTVGGRRVHWPTTPRQALRLGLALAPEDRRTQGLVLSLVAGENAVLPVLDTLTTAGFVRRGLLFRQAASAAEKVGFSPNRIRAVARTLSGGNQQKLMLAKSLSTAPKVLLIDEPVRGVDVGAKAEILSQLLQLTEQGMALIMVSEETEELLALVDRVVVLRNGTVAGEFVGEELEIEPILKSMFPT